MQVGVDKRVVVLDVPDEEDRERVKGKNLLALVNPEITYKEGHHLRGGLPERPCLHRGRRARLGLEGQCP
ncbi:MAG: peptide deformylase [Deltaproteobacteria bacterium]|nr:peptide deformylase [Deltaproteobacteria bacterium]